MNKLLFHKTIRNQESKLLLCIILQYQYDENNHPYILNSSFKTSIVYLKARDLSHNMLFQIVINIQILDSGRANICWL